MNTYYIQVEFKVIGAGYLTVPSAPPFSEEEVRPAHVTGTCFSLMYFGQTLAELRRSLEPCS